MNIKFGAILGDAGMSASDTVALAPVVEKRFGFDSLWIPDHLIDLDGARSDPYSIFGYISAVTEKVFMAPAVTDCLRIHPAKTAQILATLNELSKGRVGLGIGGGEAMSTIPFGLPFESDPEIRRQRLREYIQVVKSLWLGSKDAPIAFNGRHYQLKNAWLDQSIKYKRPPIIVEALGARKALELTGELADGWLPFSSTPEYFAKRLRVVREAAVRAGRNPDEIEPLAWVYVTLSRDAEVLKKAVTLCKLVAITERGSLREAGIRLSKDLTVHYNYQHVLATETEKMKEVAKLADEIPDNFIGSIAALGTVDDAIECIEGLVKAGARHILVNPIYSPFQETLQQISTNVLPHFNG